MNTEIERNSPPSSKSSASVDAQDSQTSLWIIHSNCKLEGIPSTYSSPFFIPTLTGASDSITAGTLEILFSGTMFIPCSLSCSLTIDDNTQSLNLSEFISETAVLARIADADVLTAYKTASSVSVSLVFGSNQSTAQSHLFTPTTDRGVKVEGQEAL